jgi:hypothetical protein
MPHLQDNQHWLYNLLYIFYMKPYPSFPSAIGNTGLLIPTTIEQLNNIFPYNSMYVKHLIVL